MRVIFDTNIWISFLIGKKLSPLITILLNPDTEVCYSAELEREFLDVAHRTKIRKYVDEKQIKRVHGLMTNCCRFETTKKKDISVRDPKDLFLLWLADETKADLLVTGDLDLLSLKQYHNTSIVSFETALSTISMLVGGTTDFTNFLDLCNYEWNE